ncbi:MAG: cell division protein FtsA [Candidatus Paceibacterota bacterium]|jgi:cell division protein FtsA|nr:cell division protein FtsA [bacterium]
MAKPQIVTGIDIGTDTIKILTVKKNPDTGEVQEVLFFDKVKSAGVQKGRVRNPVEVGKKIQELVVRAERKFDGQKLDEIYVNINGSKIEMIPSQETILVGRANGKVSAEDVERVNLQVQEKIGPVLTNKEILGVYPREWTLDDEGEIKNPIGLQGYKLKLDALVLACFFSDRESIDQALNVAGLGSSDGIIANPIADARVVLNQDLKELGVAVVNIGAGTSSVIIYQDGRLISSAVYPVGSSNITNDIAIGFKTEIEVAEKIKQQFGCCLSDCKGGLGKKIEFDLDSVFGVSLKDDNEDDEPIIKKKIEILGRQNGNKKVMAVKKEKLPKKNCFCFYERELKKIIEARVSEIFELIAQQINSSANSGLLPGGIIIVGGGAKLPGIVDVAKKEFNLPCRIGYAKDFSGLDKDPSYVTVCGLVIDELDEDEADSGKSGNGRIKGFFGKIGEIIGNLIP